MLKSLLPRPGGFEGFGFGGEPLQANDYPLAEPKDVGLIGLDTDVTTAPDDCDSRFDDDRVSEVGEVQWLPEDLREELLGLAPKLLCLHPAPVDLRVGQVAPFVQFEGGIESGPEVRRKGLDVNELGTGAADRVDDVVGSPNDLHVLLRHRPTPAADFEPNRPCRLAPDGVVDLEDLRLAWLYPHVGQYRHQTLAKRLPLLPRVPDLANTDAAIHEEGDVVLQPIRGEVTAIPFQAADGFVVLSCGCWRRWGEADNDAHRSVLLVWVRADPIRLTFPLPKRTRDVLLRHRLLRQAERLFGV